MHNSWTQYQFLKIRIIHAIAILLEWYCLNLRSKFMLPQNQICEDNSTYIRNVYQFFIWNGTFELSSFGCYIMTHYFFRKEKLCGKTCPLTKAAHRFCKIRVEHLNWDLRRKGRGCLYVPLCAVINILILSTTF